MSIRFKSIALALGCAFIVLGVLPARVQAAAVVCAGNALLLKDVFSHPLPGNPALSCADGSTPSAVVTEGKNLPLYAYGTGPYPITNFDSIARECGKLMPAGTSCFSTNPHETTLLESAICGYPAVPAYILACDASKCTAEIYSQACASTYPDLSPNQAYSAVATPLNVAGVVNESADFGNQSFATQLDTTSNLNTAERIVRQGRTPIVNLGMLLMSNDGALRPTAAQDLSAAIAKYPLVFNAPGLAIEVYDEPFAGIDLTTLSTRVVGVQKSILLLRQLLPAAVLGVVVAPVWSTDPVMVVALEAILPGLHWVATDTYAQTLDTASTERAVSLAQKFAIYMKTFHPSLMRWLVIQGFAPINSALPINWTPAQLDMFKKFLLNMVTVANTDYAGVVVWGWSSVYELPDAYSGKLFPRGLKQFYLSGSLGQ